MGKQDITFYNQEQGFNSYAYFNDVDSIINLSETLLLDSDSWFVEFKCSGDGVICGKNSTDGEILFTNTQVIFRPDGQGAAGITIPSNYTSGDTIRVEVPDKNVNSWSLYVNGAFVDSVFVEPVNGFSIDRIGAGAFTSPRFDGSIWDLNLNDQAFYAGYGNTDADWLDQVGNNNGTVTGSESLVRVPRMNGLRSKRMNFDGVDDNVAFGTITLTGDFTVSVSIYLYNFDVAYRTIGSSTNARWLFLISSPTTITFRSDSGTSRSMILDAPLQLNQQIDLRVERINDTHYLYVDGVLQSNTMTQAGTYIADRIGRQSSVYFKGYIWDVNINDQIIYEGYGNTPSDWINLANEGTDDGLIAGDPNTKFIELESSTDIVDVYGEEIRFNGEAGKWINDAESELDVVNITETGGIPPIISTATKGYGDFTGSTFSGVHGEIDITSWTSIYLSGSFKFESTSTLRRLLEIQYQGTDGFRVLTDQPDGSKIRVDADDGTFTMVQTSKEYNDNSWHTFEVILKDGSITLTVDDEVVTTSETFDFANATGNFSIGSLAASQDANFGGQLRDIKIGQSPTNLEVHIKLDKDALDFSGNGNHGVALDVDFPLYTPDDAVNPSNPIMDVDGRNQMGRLYNATATSNGIDDVINTGVTVSPTLVVEFRGRFLTLGVNDNFLGSRTAGDFFQFGVSGAGTQWVARLGDGVAETTSTEFNTSIHTFKLDSIEKKLYIDDVDVLDVPYTSFLNTTQLSLFAGAAATDYAEFELQYCRIWDNGTLVRYFVPYTHNGLLDILNNKLYYNNGSGTLVTKAERLDRALLYGTGTFGESHTKALEFTRPFNDIDGNGVDIFGDDI
jgi:hypothetical protein